MEHEAIEEMLAGYSLRSLSGEDARQADLLLSDHVPTCIMCRDLLAAFQAINGDLALAPDPVEPPEPLLARLHRELGPPSRSRRPMTLFAVAASVVAVVGMAGLAVSQGIRADHATEARKQAADLASFVSQPDAKVSRVGPIAEATRPGIEEFYIYGRGVPNPAPGMVYRLWLGTSDAPFTFVGDFLPEQGYVLIHVTAFDPSQYDSVVVTEEPAGSTPSQPAPDAIRWRAP